MSFAGKVKEELLGQMGKARHCQLAELAAFFAVCGQIYMNEEGDIRHFRWSALDKKPVATGRI